MKEDTQGVRKIRVLCVDDGHDIAPLLCECVDAEPDMESAGFLRNADSLVADVERSRADVVLLDLSMPGTDPLVALRELSARVRGKVGPVRVIAYTGHNDRQLLDRAKEAGASGYVSKDSDIPRVLDAIREVAGGRTAFGR